MRRRLAPIVVLLGLLCSSPLLAHEEGLEYQWTSPTYRQEMLLQMHVMLLALTAIVVFKGIIALIRRRRTAS